MHNINGHHVRLGNSTPVQCHNLSGRPVSAQTLQLNDATKVKDTCKLRTYLARRSFGLFLSASEQTSNRK